MYIGMADFLGGGEGAHNFQYSKLDYFGVISICTLALNSVLKLQFCNYTGLKLR